MEIRAAKPPPEGYPEDPKSVGEHLRKARMDRGLFQRDVAEAIGIETIRNWERDYTTPALRLWPRLIEFLGFIPFETGETIGERIRAWRKVHGLPRSALAERLGVDESTVWRWEAGTNEPTRSTLEKIEAMIGTAPGLRLS